MKQSLENGYTPSIWEKLVTIGQTMSEVMDNSQLWLRTAQTWQWQAIRQ